MLGNIFGKYPRLFKVGKKLGDGHCGKVYEATPVKRNIVTTKKKLIVKISKKGNAMRNEYLSYQMLKDQAGIPEVFYFCKQDEEFYLVMELVGQSIDKITNPNQTFCLSQVTTLAYKLLEIIENVHKNKLLHRSIKPANICVEGERGSQTVYLIDFGSSKSYVKPGTDEHVKYKEEQYICGSQDFLSVNAHSRIRISRRDDLESLFHTMVYMYKGSLPWQNITEHNEIETDEGNSVKFFRSTPQTLSNRMIGTKVEELCKDCPKQFKEFINHIRELQYEEEPDYKVFRKLLTEVSSEVKFDISKVDFDLKTRYDFRHGVSIIL